MLNYEYICKKCGYSVEIKHSMNDNPIVKCPQCDNTTKRLITGGVGFIMKGGNSKFFGRNERSHCGKEQTRCGRTHLVKQNPVISKFFFKNFVSKK